MPLETLRRHFRDQLDFHHPRGAERLPELRRYPPVQAQTHRTAETQPLQHAAATDVATELRKATSEFVGANQPLEKRLRPDWVQLWITNPVWMTPYTSMPQVYAADGKIMPEYLGGQGEPQIKATVDALLNYYKLLERHGKAEAPPTPPAAAAPAAAAPEAK